MAWFKKYFLNWPAPVYVLLFAAFPVLHLYAYNIADTNFGEAALPRFSALYHPELRLVGAKNLTSCLGLS